MPGTARTLRIVLSLTAVGAGLVACPPAGAVEERQSAAQRLAAEYAPITMVRKEEDPPCQKSAEQYEPTSVHTVLGNPAVKLERNVKGQKPEVVAIAPTVEQIGGLPSNYFLNYNGYPLDDTCVYARDFKALKKRGRAPAVTYAHIAREDGYDGFALQYWFFWYFNQFNDVHEADWEGMQIVFDADTPEEALGEEPTKIILFQHAGGERADWDDAKVEKEGRHPVVYPAAGSHSVFYSSAVYVENAEHGAGLGCDDTSSPLREIRPRAVLLPDFVADEGPFAWLSFRGHWGQSAGKLNSAPAGPATKVVWEKPLSWMADQRDSSARMPGGSIAGPQVTKAFCDLVEGVSEVVNAKQRSSTRTLILLALAALAIVAFVGITRWGPIDLENLRARRSFGQIVRTARRLYGRHWKPMVVIALTAIPVIGGVQYVSANFIPAGSGTLALGDLFDNLARPVATAVLAGVVIVFVRSLMATGQAGLRDSWRGMSRRFWRVVAAQLAVTIGVTLMFFSVVGIPFAIWKLVGWAFVGQEILLDNKSFRAAFRGSSELVRGRWWHAARPIAFFSLITAIVGPALTFALIFTSLPLVWINFLGSLIFALFIPYVALGETLLYLDLQARAEAEPAKARRAWRFWRPAPAAGA